MCVYMMTFVILNNLTLKNLKVKKLTLHFTILILTQTYIFAQETTQNPVAEPASERKNQKFALRSNLFSPIGVSLELGLSIPM
jgi:hypothetical protein